MTYKAIAVATNFARHSRVAYAPATILARAFGARLFLVHVADPDTERDPAAPHGSEEIRDPGQRLEREIDLEPRFRTSDVTPVLLAAEKDPLVPLNRFCQEQDVDRVHH